MEPEAQPNDTDMDTTIHGFNTSNVTVIERSAPGEGSDSGVEDAFDLQRKNSASLLQDAKDSGSETSSSSSRPSTSSKKLLAPPSTSKTTTSKKAPPKKQPNTPRPSTLKTTTVPARSVSSSRTPRTPVITPTDDGRWPSNNKSAMTRSFRASSVTSDIVAVKTTPKSNALDKYGTLPRRRRERSADNVREASATRAALTRRQTSRETTPAPRSLPPYPKKKTRIFAEATVQTSLTAEDVDKLLGGGAVRQGGGGERAEVATQTERDHEAALRALRAELAAERGDKLALRQELDDHMQRVQAMLDNAGGGEERRDSLLELETRFQGAGQIIVKQEKEISELHSLCRTLQKEVEVGLRARRHLEAAQADLEAESRELQEFLAAEKWAVCEALSEAEARARREAQAQEARARDALLAQGAAVSSAAAALAGLAARLDALSARLALAYRVAEHQLDDDVFHNEAFPQSPASPVDAGAPGFLAAVLAGLRGSSDSDELLDSETEPCLMMDSVLEDVLHVDTHSHNLVSEPGASASSLVDQVIEADNLLTRLLKVLRVIQRVQDGEAASLKADLQQHRRHVERLSQDVCALSTACSAHRDTTPGQSTASDTHQESFQALKDDLNANANANPNPGSCASPMKEPFCSPLSIY